MKQPNTGCPRWCGYADAKRHPDRHIEHLGDIIPERHVRLPQVLSVTVEAALGDTEVRMMTESGHGRTHPDLGELIDYIGSDIDGRL